VSQLRRLPSLWEEFFGESWPGGGAPRVALGPGWPSTAEAHFVPPVEILEGPDCVILIVEVPGVPREKIEVEIDGDVLTVRGEKPFVEREQGERFLRIECAYGPFERSFALGIPTDPASVVASYREGLLRLRIPKVRREPSRVTVKVE
jgi:HSP20 family protein